MPGVESQSRPRRVLAGLILWAVVLAAFALAVAFFLIGLAGFALLVAGVSSWLRPADAASAWARTLAGIGLIGGSAGFAALGWLAAERLAGPLGRFARLRNGAARSPSAGEIRRRLGDGTGSSASGGETPLQRARKFVAAIGILLALICLPFAAAIHATTHGTWLGWGG